MKAKQWQEIKSMTVAELEAKLRNAEEQMFRLKFKHSVTPMKNGLQIRTIRRNIAQFKTLLHQKNVAAAQSVVKNNSNGKGK